MQPGLDQAAQRLRFAREQRGMSLTELSREARINYHTLWRHESGRSDISQRTAAAYAAALGVSTQWLLHGIGASPSPDTQAVINEYLQTEYGRTTSAEVVECLRRLSFADLGVVYVTREAVHRVRELIEVNRLLGRTSLDGKPARVAS